MAHPNPAGKNRRSRDEVQMVVEAVNKCGGNISKAARELNARGIGLSRLAVMRAYRKAMAARGIQKAAQLDPYKPFEVAPLPSELPSAEELIERRKRQYTTKSEAEEARRLISVKVKIGGPIGIVHMGDPHVDDDGTDIGLLEKHVNVINRTEGLFGANVGDMSNNWVGRLARLYGEQSTSAAESWVLVDWFVNSVQWLYMVGGNHDCWSGAGDPIKWMLRNQQGVYEAWGVRMNLQFPNGKAVRINARHDFSGHSMWNPNHGPMKAVNMGWRDHILTCGHKHEAFVTGPQKCPSTGLLSWAVRCGTYKVHDRYGKEKGLPDQCPFSAAVTIIDPQYADDDNRLITVFTNVEEGAEYLTWKRMRAAA